MNRRIVNDILSTAAVFGALFTIATGLVIAAMLWLTTEP